MILEDFKLIDIRLSVGSRMMPSICKNRKLMQRKYILKCY